MKKLLITFLVGFAFIGLGISVFIMEISSFEESSELIFENAIDSKIVTQEDTYSLSSDENIKVRFSVWDVEYEVITDNSLEDEIKIVKSYPDYTYIHTNSNLYSENDVNVDHFRFNSYSELNVNEMIDIVLFSLKNKVTINADDAREYMKSNSKVQIYMSEETLENSEFVD